MKAACLSLGQATFLFHVVSGQDFNNAIEVGRDDIFIRLVEGGADGARRRREVRSLFSLRLRRKNCTPHDCPMLSI